jgi:hypothetical protein
MSEIAGLPWDGAANVRDMLKKDDLGDNLLAFITILTAAWVQAMVTKGFT